MYLSKLIMTVLTFRDVSKFSSVNTADEVISTSRAYGKPLFKHFELSCFKLEAQKYKVSGKVSMYWRH